MYLITNNTSNMSKLNILRTKEDLDILADIDFTN